jgi:hypothetical protein
MLLRAGAGSRPGGRGTFLCFAKEKYPKERRPHCLRPCAALRATCGALGRGVPQNSLRAKALRSDNCGKSVDEACVPMAHRPPHPLRSSAHAEGVGEDGCCYAVTPGGGTRFALPPDAGEILVFFRHHRRWHIGVVLSLLNQNQLTSHKQGFFKPNRPYALVNQTQFAINSEATNTAPVSSASKDTPGRAQQRPVWLFGPHPLLDAPRSATGGVACVPRAHRLRPLTCRSCLNEAPWRVVSSAAHPAREHRRLPVAQRRVAGSGVAFSLLTFFWRSKRK